MTGRRFGLVAACLATVACGAQVPAPPPDRIFVSQAGSSTVAVIDPGSGTVTSRIEVGLLPHDLLPSRDLRSLYVAVVGSQAIAEIDTATGTLRRTFLTAPVPELRADGTVIQGHRDQDAFRHATCFDCHDGRPGSPAPKYPGDRPFGLLLSPDGQRLLVAHLRSGDLAEIDLTSGRLARTVHLPPTGEAREPVALALLGSEIYVAMRPPQPSTAPGAVRRLDAATLAVLGETPTGADPGSLLALPDRGRVLVTNFETDTVSEHDATGVVRRHLASPGPLGLLALPGGRGAMALDYYSNAVTLLDLEGGPARTLPLVLDGAPYVNPTHAALSTDGTVAWIVSSGTDGHLLAFDLAQRQVVRDLPVDGLSFGVAVVPGSAP
jgi:YVTN family beta-propeller protein